MTTATSARQVAEELRSRRNAHGVSQEGIARLANCSTAMVRLLERRHDPATSAVIGRLLAVLDDLDASTKRGSLAGNEAPAKLAVTAAHDQRIR